MSGINQDDVMWFLGICRFEAIESLLRELIPDFESKYAEAYRQKITEGVDKNPEFKALLKDMENQQTTKD